MKLTLQRTLLTTGEFDKEDQFQTGLISTNETDLKICVSNPVPDDIRTPDQYSASQTRSAPLLLHNLLNDLEELTGLFNEHLRRGAWLEVFLLAAGMNQIVEDYLHPDPLLLERANKYLRGIKPPIGFLAIRTADSVRSALLKLNFLDRKFQRTIHWQVELNRLVQSLAKVVINPAAIPPASLEDMLVAGQRLVGSIGDLPSGLLSSILRLPSCFRSFDQQPADLELICREFSQRWPQLSRPLAVIGIRTSGSYLAPLAAAYLRDNGYLNITVLTLRPGRPFMKSEREAVQTVIEQNGLVLVCDDPPDSGRALKKSIRDLERAGVPENFIILLLQLFGDCNTLPPALQKFPVVLLPWQNWTIHKKLSPAAVQLTLQEMLEPDFRVKEIKQLTGIEQDVPRSHVQRQYQATLINCKDGKQTERLIQVKGAGLGYFGEHWLAVEQGVKGFVSEIYSLKDGLLYQAGLPEKDGLISQHNGHFKAAARSIAEYVYARHRGLPVKQDVATSLFGQGPAWEAASNLLSQAFGRVGLAVRIPLVDPLVKRLLSVAEPSVIDGNLAVSQWYLRETPAGALIKTGYADFDFSHLDLYCYDPVFDIAGIQVESHVNPLSIQVRDFYQEISGKTISEERWLLYRMVHIWDLYRKNQIDLTRMNRALARVVQQYYSELYFKDLLPDPSGKLCAIDIDGVVETEHLGYPSLSPASALALRSLILHGYQPVLATGRCLDEVRERCEAYHLSGGVAEYGAVMYNHRTGTSQVLLSSEEQADLEQLRAILGKMEGIYLDPDYLQVVRAYRLLPDGQKCSLSPETAGNILDLYSGKNRIRAIQGDSQTDFMVLGVDKGKALRLLAAELLPNLSGEDRHLFSLAVGDTLSDIPMFELSERAFAPAHADPAMRSAGVLKMKSPYQAGFSQAVAWLLCHRPGSCPNCHAPDFSADTHLLLSLFGAQETGEWGMVWKGLHLWAKLR